MSIRKDFIFDVCMIIVWITWCVFTAAGLIVATVGRINGTVDFNPFWQGLAIGVVITVLVLGYFMRRMNRAVKRIVETNRRSEQQFTMVRKRIEPLQEKRKKIFKDFIECLQEGRSEDADQHARSMHNLDELMDAIVSEHLDLDKKPVE